MNDIRPAKERPVIIALPEDTVIGSELIDYCTRRHMADLQRYRRLDRYYMNENEIGNRIFKDGSKPNNRIAHAFARYITCIATAYFLGSGVKIECEDPEYRDALNELYQSHMAEVKHYEEAKGMSKFGRAFELLYIDRDGNDRTASIQPSDMIPVYGEGIDRFLIFVIYLYKTVKIVGGIETAIEHADVYTADRVYTYERRAGTASRWMRTGDYAHGYSDVPVIVRWNSTDQKGDYEDVIPQIDAYDRAQSDTANDLDYFTDAYLAITGAEEISLDGETRDEPAHHARGAVAAAAGRRRCKVCDQEHRRHAHGKLQKPRLPRPFLSGARPQPDGRKLCRESFRRCHEVQAFWDRGACHRKAEVFHIV